MIMNKIFKKVEKESIDIYSVICPKCGDKFILGELDEEELTEYNFNCRSL